MKDAKLDVIVKAIDLMQYTLIITSNRKRYPVKHLILIRRIQERCMDIYENLLNANRLHVVNFKQERLNLQTKAISCCDQLSCYVEISMKMNLIGMKTVEYWQKQIEGVKYMTIAWRSKDQKR